MLSATANIVLVAVHVLSACIWVGGFVAIGVVSHVAGGQLTPAARVTFFRALGRAYGAVAGAALLVALAMGAVLISERPWDAATTVGVLLACALVLITLVAVVQARRMTCLRERALTAVLEPTLRAVIVRRAAVATVLRGAIGLLTVALVVVGVIMVTATPADHARRLGSASSSPTGGAG